METANPDFFKNLSLLARPRLLLPHLQIPSISNLPAALERLDIRGLILDVDQTVAPYGSPRIPEDIARVLKQLRQDYRCCYVSNVPNTAAARMRLRMIETATSIHAIPTESKKPALPVFQAALDHLGTLPRHTAMVGDRLFTDVLGANNAGLRSILVKPLDWTQDPPLITTIRLVEKLLLYILLLRR